MKSYVVTKVRRLPSKKKVTILRMRAIKGSDHYTASNLQEILKHKMEEVLKES